MSTHADDMPNPVTARDPDVILNRRRRGVRVTYAAAVALGLAIGGGAVAGAATGSSSTSTTTPADHTVGPGPHFGMGGTPPAAFGAVTSVGADTFTLMSPDGTKVTVNVNGTISYVDPGVTSPTIADVKVGDHVAVFGTDTANTVSATKVAIGGPPAPGAPGGPGGPWASPGAGPTAFGTVASVGTGTFTVRSPDGTTVTVDVSSSTSYMEFGTTSPTIADVKVGDHVAVFGTDTNNTVTATKVGIGGPEGPGGAGRPGGPGGSAGPGGPGRGDGPGGWGPAPSTGTSSGTPSSGNSTSSSSSSAGGTLA